MTLQRLLLEYDINTMSWRVILVLYYNNAQCHGPLRAQCILPPSHDSQSGLIPLKALFPGWASAQYRQKNGYLFINTREIKYTLFPQNGCFDFRVRCIVGASPVEGAAALRSKLLRVKFLEDPGPAVVVHPRRFVVTALTNTQNRGAPPHASRLTAVVVSGASLHRGSLLQSTPPPHTPWSCHCRGFLKHHCFIRGF